jgi:hypothetical protein
VSSVLRKQILAGACLAFVLATSNAAAGPLAGNNAVAPSGARGISAESLAKAQTKFAHAQQIAAQFAVAAEAEGLPSVWRAEMITALMRAPEAQFAQVQTSATARDALMSAHDIAASPSIAVSGGLGDVGADLTFVPLTTPCRIVDTRVSGAGGPLTHATRAFSLSGSAAQGSSSSCNSYGYIGLVNPGAIAVNIVADASGYTAAVGSFLRAYPDGGSASTSWLNFSTGEVVANAGVLGLNTSNAKFDIFVNATANVIVDVYGSFVAPDPTPLECTTVKSTAAVLATVGATCPSGYTVTGGGCDSDSIYDYTYSATIAGNGYSCGFFAIAPHSVGDTLTASAQCCRVPGRPEPLL